MNKIYQFFAFSFYIRILLETNQFLMLSSFSELYEFNTSSTSNIISLLSAFAGAFICIWLILLSLINYVLNRNVENIETYNALKEFFSGIKHGNYSKLYSTLLLMRRMVFASILIFGQSFSNIGLICPMIIIQFAYLLNLVIVRPYKLAKDNIIEIVNELFYFLLIFILSYFNSKDRWSSIIENAYLIIILGNSVTIILIMIGKRFLVISFFIDWFKLLKRIIKYNLVAFAGTTFIKIKKIWSKNRTIPKKVKFINEFVIFYFRNIIL